MNRNVYIIAGPNGSGKTTFATSFLPNFANCTQFINADLIAKGVAPFSPDTVAVRAGRIMLEEIARLANVGEEFGIETTLSGKTLSHLIRDLKKRGYTIHLFFLYLPNPELVSDEADTTFLPPSCIVDSNDPSTTSSITIVTWQIPGY